MGYQNMSPWPVKHGPGLVAEASLRVDGLRQHLRRYVGVNHVAGEETKIKRCFLACRLVRGVGNILFWKIIKLRKKQVWDKIQMVSLLMVSFLIARGGEGAYLVVRPLRYLFHYISFPDKM